MNIKWNTLILPVLLPALLWSTAAAAFSDLAGEPAEGKILALHKAGIINGMDDQTFAPKEKITFAQGIHLIVKGLNLNIDNMRFIKEPKASDYFTHVPDDVWYAQSFIIAHLNGVPLAKDVNPNGLITREEFVHYLISALRTKGDFPVIERYVLIQDEADIRKDFMDSIQFALNTNILSLDENRNFKPKSETTRSDAAGMVYDARQLLLNRESANPPAPRQDVTVSVEKVNDQVNKVVLSRGEKPNAGYRITIDHIDFKTNGEAVIYYILHDPVPGNIYAQVITYPKAATYISSEYKPVIRQSPDQSVSQSTASSLP
jgi:hypothetical protein